VRGHKGERDMPIVQISMIAGRTPEKKEQLIKRVTDAIAETLEIPKERVHIVLQDVPRDNIGDGGVPLSKINS
jgi:4-oxalocrotonate tautomerase